MERIQRDWKRTSNRKGTGETEENITPAESEVIKKAFDRFKSQARMLEPVIDSIYNIHIPFIIDFTYTC